MFMVKDKEEWIKKIWYMDKEDMVHLHDGILFSHKKDEIMPFAVTWMHLEMITLNEVNQTEKDKYHMILLIYGILRKRYK